MMNHNSHLDDTVLNRLQLIREYDVLKEKLVSKAVSKLNPTATEYDFEDSFPSSITTDDGITWSVRAHGLGVIFTNPLTFVVVDAHVGFIDAPTVFDAWRLVQYSESRLRTNEDFKSWQQTLDELDSIGTIEPHSKHTGHFVVK